MWGAGSCASCSPAMCRSRYEPSICITGPLVKGDAMDGPRKLYRSRTNRQLAGVCGGVAEYFNIDATLVRVLFVVFAVLGGPGLLAYLLLWIFVPEEPVGAA